MEDKEVMEAMQVVDDALGTGGGDAESAEAERTFPNPCEAYEKIREILPTLISLAQRIPVVGKRLAAALKLLKQIGDQFCPRSQTANG